MATAETLFIDREWVLAELQPAFAEPAAESLARVLNHVAVKAHLTDVVTRRDFAELRGTLEHLAETVGALAEAQRQTLLAVDQLRRQVGGLSETVGGDIEDIAYIVLYDVLQREFGWQVGVLERSWQVWDGKPEEVNVFGQARDPTRPERLIWIVGEAKHNLTLKEVNRFARQAERARLHLIGEVFPVCFCYRARPEVRERLQELNIRLVFSYGRMV